MEKQEIASMIHYVITHRLSYKHINKLIYNVEKSPPIGTRKMKAAGANPNV